MSDISVGSVAVDVIPSAKGWINKLRAQVLPDADLLGIEVGRTLSARINEALGNAHLTVDVDSAVADAQLLATEGIVDRLDGRKVNLDIGAGGGGVNRLGTLLDGVAGPVGEIVSAVGLLGPALALVAVALVPVVASVTGLAAALVLPLAAAGGGLGLGAVLAGFAIKNVEKTSKKIDQLRQRAAALHGQAKKDALDQANSLEKSLSGPQKAFLNAQGKLGAAFAKLQTGKVGDALFAPLVSGMTLLSKILPALAPVIEFVSHALTGLLDSLGKSASGKGFKTLVDGFAALAGATITSGAKSAGLFIEGLFNIFKDFLPLSGSVGDGLVGLAAKFLAFSQKTSTKQGIQSFIDYVKANGPVVLRLLGQFVKSLVEFGINAAPVGAKIISTLGRAFSLMNSGFVAARQSASVVGKTFRTIYNSTIGPVFAAIIGAIAKVMQATGKMLSLLGRAPGFGWAKKLGDSLQTAAGHANGLADAIRKIPTSHKTTITVTTVHKGGKTITGGGNKGSVYASGTNDSNEGVALVGELGPELVYLPGHSKVVTASATSRMLANATPGRAASAASGPVHVKITNYDVMTGHLELIADDRIAANGDFASTIGRQG